MKLLWKFWHLKPSNNEKATLQYNVYIKYILGIIFLNGSKLNHAVNSTCFCWSFLHEYFWLLATCMTSFTPSNASILVSNKWYTKYSTAQKSETTQYCIQFPMKPAIKHNLFTLQCQNISLISNLSVFNLSTLYFCALYCHFNSSIIPDLNPASYSCVLPT